MMEESKFPNIEHNLTEIQFNGHIAILAEEKKDKQFQIIYHVDNLLIYIFTQNVSREELNKIIKSIY